MRSRLRGVTTGLATALVVAAAAGCVRMPVDGPVVEMDPPALDDPAAGTFYDPAPPTPGASSQEVVAGFLDAMTATPVRTNVAAQFLSRDAQARWKPDGIITYSDLEPPVGERRVQVRLKGAQRYDGRGAWTRSLPPEEARLELPMTIERSEWRIDAAPDALVVPDSWFDDQYERASLHFLDPTGRILVPEPVFVPERDQFATGLVQGLLAGPPPGLERVVRTAVPAGLTLGLSVPITDGVAEVALEGPVELREGLVSEEMVAQLAWTLRQERRIESVRITLNGEPLLLPGGAREIEMDDGERFGPDGFRTPPDLFALRDGLLVRGQLDDLQETVGPFGATRYGLRSAGVNLGGSLAAGVTDDGSSVLLAPISDSGAEPTPLVSGAVDLLPPAWDFADRAWLVDRTPAGARLSVVADEEVRGLRAPGLTGADVRRFVVSRDGSRIVAVVRGPRMDRLLVARVQHDDTGQVLRVGRAREIDLGFEPGRRIRDVGWRSPVSVAVLAGLTGGLSQVRTVAVDGAPGLLDTAGAAQVPGRASDLVTSPSGSEGVLVLGTEGIVDLLDPGREIPPLDEQIRWLGYVG